MLSDSQLSITETGSEMFYDAEEYLLSDAGSSSDSEVGLRLANGLATFIFLEEDAEKTFSLCIVLIFSVKRVD